MKKCDFLKNGKASLFGYGLTTKAIAEILGQKMGGFEIYDDHFKQISQDEFGNTLKPVSEFDAQKSSLEIPSPGFPCEHELVKKAKHLISEYDFFYDSMPKSVWISGTNGKTTTTQMTQHLLGSVGSVMGGNVGVPLAKLEINAKIWILETSSFTLHYTKTAKPEIYALLPITKDHISWHKTFAKYVKAKLSVLKRMHENDVAILPSLFKDKVDTKAYTIFYKDEFDLAKQMEIDIKKINFQSPFLLDALLALSIEKILLDCVSYDKINTFVMEKNKLEEFKDKQNRLWVNDTKATNLNACEAALKRYEDKKIHLILGGDSKGVSLKPLFAVMKNLKLEIYAIGACEAEILELAKNHKIKATPCKTLDQAVLKINALLKKGEVALLSPACASLDQFSSYAQRGEVFKECVAKL